MTSAFIRRRRYGEIRSLSIVAQRYAVTTCCCDALEYPPSWIGTANCAWNTGSVPSLPGKQKSKRLQSSDRRF